MSEEQSSRSRGLNLEQQKKRAKDLLRACRRGEVEARERVARQLPGAAATPAGVARPLALSEAQLVVAREAGFASWPRLKRELALARLGASAEFEALLALALAGDDDGVDTELAAQPDAASRSLHVAAAVGDADSALAMLAGAPERARERGGLRDWSALFYTCSARFGRARPHVQSGRVAIARRLLELGADANEEIESDAAPGGYRNVLSAAAGGAANAELVDLLLANNARLEPTGGSAGPALALIDAVKGGNIACLQRLLDARPDLWHLRETLEVAIEHDRVDMCRLLLERGADANGAGRWWGQHGSALHTAILLGRGRELFEALLASGVDLERGDRDRRTAYAWAVRTGHEAAAELLVARGANIELGVVDRLLRSALAADTVEVRALLAAHPELRAGYRRTDHQVLCWALRHRRYAAVPCLLECGLDPNVADDHGETPLHLAAGHAPSVAALLSAGASTSTRNFRGDFPLQAAVPAEERAERQLSFEAALRALLDGDVEHLRELVDLEPELVFERSRRAHRATLLHYVAANGVEHQGPRQCSPAAAKLLLERGADADALAHTYGGGPGQTTLGLAVTSFFPEQAGVIGELVSVLVAGGASVDGIDGEGGPLAGAIGHHQTGAVAALVAAGARIVNLWCAAAAAPLDVVDSFARTASARELGAALVVAGSFDRADVIGLLLERGADIAAQDAQGFTGMHWAGWYRNLAALEVLLARGAPLELCNRYGGTVLGTAVFACREAVERAPFLPVIERLCAAGARTDIIRTGSGDAAVDAVLARYGFRPQG
jgi:ankyrin repeat protein